ncbi:MAG TPA: radical SAM protein, partial [Amphiplicatus sp.]|nr:radical SAM protein [Amphiplicatus sp.]
MADGEALSAEKFQNADVTASGAARASVPFDALETLWINTGTLCNIECAHCYIESSPKNDRLAYITRDEAAPFLDEAEALGAREIGFTGGEPFMNPEMIGLARDALARRFEALILTNAMRPMMRPRVREGLLSLREEFGVALTLRIS